MLLCQMHNRKINVAFIGCGRWTRTEVLPTLAKDGRVTCAAFFAFHLTTIDVVKSIFLHLRVSPGDTGSRRTFVNNKQNSFRCPTHSHCALLLMLLVFAFSL